MTRLFETAPDLLEDFKQFLPESAAAAKAAGARAAQEDAFPLSNTRTEPTYTAAAMQHAHIHQTPSREQPRLPPMGNFAPTPSTNRDNKRKRGEKQANLVGMPPAMPEILPPRPVAGQPVIGSKVSLIDVLKFPLGPPQVCTFPRGGWTWLAHGPHDNASHGPATVVLQSLAAYSPVAVEPFLINPLHPIPLSFNFLQIFHPSITFSLWSFSFMLHTVSMPIFEREYHCQPVDGHSTRSKAPNKRPYDGPRANFSGQRAKHQHAVKPPIVDAVMPQISPNLVPPLPMPMRPVYTQAPTAEDLNFFDRVRKHLNNKSQYSEFLKLMNLYTQDLCSAAWLVYRVQAFIGNNPELFKWFKNFIGAEPEDEVIEQAPMPPTNKVALANCRGLGPSYRLLPKVEQHKLCSGRDQLCMSVLNDEWVSHPTWASEDSGFVAHRKNQFEEGLHRIEEERHDYDTHIGVADRTIQLLEPIAQQLATLSADARTHLEVAPNLGGQSEFIPRRAIYKIYGRERGVEVMNRLRDKPYDVIPTLLDRLRQKREEWRAAQREWNKVWRMQTGNLFWRSLDHQGAGAKHDKRQFTTKAIQQEIMVREAEQKRGRDITLKAQAPFHLEVSFEDESLIYDCCTLLLAWAQANNATQEQPKLPNFIREFAATFFGIDPENIRESFQGDEHIEGDGNESDNQDEGSSPRYRTASRKTGGLLREVFSRGRTGRSRRDGDGSISESRASSAEPQSGVDEDMPNVSTPPADDALPGKRSEKTWLDIPTESGNGDAANANQEYGRTTYNLYSNWNTYTFFRLFSLLYERLLRLKRWESYVHEQVAQELIEKPATKIGWIEKMPGDFFLDVSPGANYYSQMLLKFEELLTTGSSDIQTEVEETLRHFYLFFGSQLYHCDKLVAHCIKHAVSIVSNDTKDNSWNVWQAFKRDRLKEKTTHNDELVYRKQVEKLSKDHDVIRISYVSFTQ